MMRLFLIWVIFCKTCFANEFQISERVNYLTQGLVLDGIGLEVAPFFRPTLLKKDYKIYYTDYTSAAELIKKHTHLPIIQQIKENIVEVDFIWPSGTSLSRRVRGRKFDYAIASHVIEHVPNVIGWVSQILDVLKPGGILSLAVPDKRYTFDAYRRETELMELIDLWIRDQSIPSPGQIFDMLTNSADVPADSTMPFEEGIPFENLHRNYTDAEALLYALHTHRTGLYLDIHCSVFTPEGFETLFLKLHELGILNIAVSKPISVGSEFFVQFKKLGEPTVYR